MWLQAFGRLTRWISARPSLIRLGAPSVLLAVLLMPSIWMLTRIPPLWRDIDAYVQVTQPPGPGTILHYGPLYCFVARIPLYLGYAIDCIARGAPLPTPSFFLHPTLSDWGVFTVILLQHLSLCFATFWLIAETTRLFWIRLLLAAAWAANPLFYTFAHCIGTETLSLILVLLIGTIGLRIIRYSRSVPRKEWLLFGVLLWLCILTRHINAALAGLLPLTFLLLSAYRLMMMRFARSQLLRLCQGIRGKQALQKAGFAVAVGISCIVLTNVSLRWLCYTTKTHYHSTVGFTFLFRLKFLAGLPVETRNQLLDKVSQNTDSADVKRVVSLLRDSFGDDNPIWDVAAFKKKAQESLFSSQTDTSENRLYIVLNSTARTFLYPPEKIFLSAVASDFKKSQGVTIPSVVRQLFVATAFYFSHPGIMPDCASLYTFRDKSSAQMMAIFKHSYFQHSKNFSFGALLFLWCVTLALLGVVAKVRKKDIAAVSSYAAALTLVGLFMMLANCFLTVFQPRFTLPMWELTILSVSILSAKTLEYIFASGKRRQELTLR